MKDTINNNGYVTSFNYLTIVKPHPLYLYIKKWGWKYSDLAMMITFQLILTLIWILITKKLRIC